MPEFVYTSDANPVLPVFYQAVISNSKETIYVSGNIGCDKNFKLVGDVKAQTRAALENIAVILKAAGSGLEHIVKANIYLTNMPRDFAPMQRYNYLNISFRRPAYTHSQWDKGKMPARTCIGVASLPMGADFEIECTAEIPK
ncbi:Endoribonuclease L-PSP [Rhodocollybia butyracea]|uniref:Endoribonuclease L-PSP n=1 Tax=Rhodocollybia butyracea TaxID=206335 RepID=A0A9P5PYQ7_9AGAR|nr:Endoribonuclease L-PSP [Rhodocollybia butyracea]